MPRDQSGRFAPSIAREAGHVRAVKAKDIGPYTPRHRLRRIDRRSREWKFLAATEAELIEHLGGADRASVPQRILVGRIAADLLRCELLDEKAAAGTMTEKDGNVAHALRNSIRLALSALGMHAPAAKPRSLADYARSKAASA